MTLFRYFILAVGAVGMALVGVGCLETTALVKVKTDGSGTINLRVILDTGALRDNVLSAAEMIPEARQRIIDRTGQEVPPIPFEMPTAEQLDTELKKIKLYDRAKLTTAASHLGRNVKLVRAQEIDADGRKGFLAEYSFANIADLSLSGLSKYTMEQIGEMAGEQMDPQTQMMAQQANVNLIFEFTPGNPATLALTPLGGAPAPAPNDPGMEPGMEMGMQIPEEAKAQLREVLREMIKVVRQATRGLSIACYMQVEGTIDETTAVNRMKTSPGTITLFYLNAGQLFGNAEQFVAMIDQPPTSFEAFMRKGLQGLRVEDLSRGLTVKFH